MDLVDLLEGVGEKPALRAPVVGLSLDSRTLRTGEVFFALPGSRCHGLTHGEQAIRHGASAIVYDPAGGGTALADALQGRIFLHPVAALGQELGFIASRYFGDPSQRLETIGVTGTNGKTSCTHFIAQALGTSKPCAVMGTLGWGKPGELGPTLNTTPDPIALHGALALLVERRFRALAMEVSSHGLDQGRVNGVRFKGALFTNVSRDHLDYHGTMEAYLGAKLKLLAMPGLEFAVCNLDDPSAAAVRRTAPAGLSVWGFSRRGNHKGNALLARDVIQDEAGISLIARHAGESVAVRAPVFGDFNVENVLACLTVLLALGFPLGEAAQRMADIRAVPGRMERFGAGLHAPAVVVDYAHSPHALESVLRSLRPHCSGKLVAVFGCGGDRDRGKRPLMGEVASEWADEIILTDDNPRSEDGELIIAEILQGCTQPGRVTVIRNRRAAIETAIRDGAQDDVILVAGKGHETTQEIGNVKHAFSDRQVVREALMQRKAPS